MAKKLKTYRRQTDKIYKIPASVQEAVPICRIAENGIFELEDRSGLHLFDRCYVYEDINFTTQDEDEKEVTAEKFKKLLNSMNVSFKMIVANQSADISALKENVLTAAESKDYEPLAQAYNQIKKKRVTEGKNGIEQVRYFIITCVKPDYEAAKSFFATIEASLTISFNLLGSGLVPLNAARRLRALHSFYRTGKESLFGFNWDEYLEMKRDWRNDIVPTSMREHKDYIELEKERVCSVLFVRSYASGLSDVFIRELTNVSFETITTMDCDPVDNDYAMKILMQKYMSTERSIDRQQENKNKNGNYSTDVSYEKRKEKEELEEYMDELRRYDEKMFYVGITIVVSAENREELANRVDTIKTIGSSHNMEIVEHEYNQLDGLNTTLPTGARFVNTMRALLTDSLSVFMPFNVQQISDKKGLYYGVNQVSKDLILGDRLKLKNGNGFIFGVPGSGKSMDAKMEMGQVMAFRNDDVLVVDPMGEYKEIAKAWNGEYINYSQAQDNTVYTNPLHVPNPDNITDRDMFIAEKAEFAYAICERALKPDLLKSGHISVIDRAVRMVYTQYFELAEKKKKAFIASHQQPESPTLITLREKISEIATSEQNEEADDLAKALDTFATGTLNIFAHQDTVKSNNRFTVFGLSELGKQMRGLAMLVMIETITSRIKYNVQNLKATWVYVDEIHELWDDPYSLLAIQRLWREVRKKGGLCTGITQNIIDGTRNNETKTMISNSEFMMLLNQGSLDKDVLRGVFEVSNAQLSYVNGVERGTGLLKFGSKIIPFDNTVEKESRLYQLFNTNFHEIAASAGGQR